MMHQSLSEQAENTKHHVDDIVDDEPAPPNQSDDVSEKKSGHAQAVAQVESENGNESTADSSEAAEESIEESEKQEADTNADQSQQADEFEQHEEEEEEGDSNEKSPSQESKVKQKVQHLTKKLASKALVHKKKSKTEVKAGNNKKKSGQALA